MSNELRNRKAILSAYGSTGATNNEAAYSKSLIAAVKAGGNSKTKPQIAALTAVSTANATDLTTAQALANANKAAINAIIAALKA